MLIVDASKDRYLDGSVEAFSKNASGHFRVATEHWMDVFINEQLAMRIVCTPEHLDEFVFRYGVQSNLQRRSCAGVKNLSFRSWHKTGKESPAHANDCQGGR